MKEAEPRGNRPAKRRYESAIVLGFATVFVVLWILSLSGVRARLATRAWEAGDIEGAYRLASLATRQRPEMADMWLLQARCEDHLESPCEAAISYARAALAATEQLGEELSALTTSTRAPSADLATDAAASSADELREVAIHQALAAAAACGSISTIATVFEALTTGLPSSPENRSGIWPGDPELATGRPTAAALASALPEEPETQFPWIEFFWRRQILDAAVAAAAQLGSHRDDLPAAGLSLTGRALLAAGRPTEAAEAFRQALHNDPGWVPAAAVLSGLEPAGEAPNWNQQQLALESARVDAEVFDARPEVFLLATNGSLTFEVAAPHPGERVFFSVDVRGTPAYGRFPELGVWVDGRQVAAVEATRPALPVIVEVPASPGASVEISFVFANDWADETGDRNVFFSAPKLYARE